MVVGILVKIGILVIFIIIYMQEFLARGKFSTFGIGAIKDSKILASPEKTRGTRSVCPPPPQHQAKV